VSSIHQNLRLNDGDDTVLLADSGIASEATGVLLDGELRGLIGADLENSTPLGEAATDLVVLGASLVEIVVTLSGGLAVGARKGLYSL
jgi:hypothetical protein